MWSLLKEIQKQAKTKGFSHFIIKSLTPQEKKTLRIIYLIAFERTYSTNVTDIEENPKIYGQEEADASIVSHAMDVCRKDPFSEMKIGCYNTGVLLILLSYSEQLPSTTVFKTTEHLEIYDLSLQGSHHVDAKLFTFQCYDAE